MKSFELQPTDENIEKTFLKDAIGRNQDIFYFTSILNSIEDNCSIALDGRWGSGKTFFVRQAKMLLDANNPNSTSMTEKKKKEIIEKWLSTRTERDEELLQYVSVYFDAWASDNDGDPILSLVYSILQEYDSEYTFKITDKTLETLCGIADTVTGRNISGILTPLKRTDQLAGIKSIKGLHNEIAEFLDSLPHERGNRLIIFVDELDRCKPSFAVALLERIKHYFTNERITFVFSINTSELQHTIKKHYGNDFDASRYLDRFFDLRISLPPLNRQKYLESISFVQTSAIVDDVQQTVIEKYNFGMREIAKYLRLTKMAVFKTTHQGLLNRGFDGETLSFCHIYIVPVMIALKITDTSRYQDFVSGKDYSPLLELFEADDDHCRYTERWLCGLAESFVEVQGKTLIKLSERIYEIYDAVFSRSFNGSDWRVTIGGLTFSIEIRENVFRTESLLSGYVDLD